MIDAHKFFEFTLKGRVRKLFRMSRIYLTILLSLFTFAAFAADAPEDLFQKGLEAYQKRDFPAAREAFEAIDRDGHADARVLHNLALTYYQLNQKPHAVALWRKALAVDPGYAAARTGRDLLENRFNMRPFERDALGSRWRHTLEYVSIYEVLWLFAALLSLAGWLVIRYASERRAALDEERPLPTFPLPATLASVLLVVVGLTFVFKLMDTLTERATVVTDSGHVRSLPNDESVALFEIPGGSEVLVRRVQEGWTQVQDSSGSTGWVKAAELLVTSGR